MGHSHGGSVIAHALTSLALDSGEVLDRITSCTTVGTPFMRYGPRLSELLRWSFATVVSLVVAGTFAFAVPGTHVGYAFRATPWQFCVWAGLAIGALAFVAFTVFRSFAVIRTQLRERRRHGAAQLRLQSFEPRWLCLWSSEDEPTIGIGASGSFRQAFATTAAINQFANNLMARSLQGSDINALELRSVGPQALPSHHVHAPLPTGVDKRLIGNANTAASVLGGTLRGILMSAKDPVFGLDDLKRIAPERVTFKELVHTTYFDDPACLELIAHHVSATGAGSDVPCEAELQSWYASRWSFALAPAGAVYPSNRVGYLVGVVSLIIAVIATLATLTGNLLARAALWPTTSQYWLRQAQADPGPLLLYADSNYQDFSAMADRLALWALSKDAKAFATALETFRASKPAAIRMKRAHYPEFVEAIGAGGMLTQWIRSDFIGLVATSDSEAGPARQEVIALAGSALARYTDDVGGPMLDHLEIACGEDQNCRAELYAAVIEGLAVKGNAKALADVSARHAADISSTSTFMRPSYTPKSTRIAATGFERLVDAAGPLVAAGRWNSAARLISGELQRCGALADPKFGRDIDASVAALLREHGRRGQGAGAAAQDIQLLDAAIYLGGCGKLTPATLDALGEALAEKSRLFDLYIKASELGFMWMQGASADDVALGQAYRGNCEAIASAKFLQTRSIAESLHAKGLCAVDFVPQESVEKKLEMIRSETWRKLVVQTVPYLMRGTSASAERVQLLEALFQRIHGDCRANVADTTGKGAPTDADQALVSLYHLVPIHDVTSGSQASKRLDELVAAIEGRQLKNCRVFDFSQPERNPSRKFENFLVFVKWLAPAFPALAARLEATVLAQILSSGPGSAPAMVYDVQRHLLKKGQLEEALRWTNAAAADPRLADKKVFALASYAACAQRSGRPDQAKRIFEELAARHPIAVQASATRSAIAIRLADWYAEIEDWRGAFTFCSACDLNTRNAVQDRVIDLALTFGERSSSRSAEPC